MATVTKIGPEDHGRPMTEEEYTAGDYEQGFKYELIDGRLYVSPEANFPEYFVEDWFVGKLKAYATAHPEVVKFVAHKARVFVPGRRGTTIPEPDFTVYHSLPRRRSLRDVRWQDLRPMLVGEILSAGDPDKDLVRNVELYLHVPSIKEYWVVDSRSNADQPRLTVYRRHGQRWRTLAVAFGATYATKLLPGLALRLDPRILSFSCPPP